MEPVLDLFPVIEAFISDLADNVEKSEIGVVIDLGIRDLEFFSDLLRAQPPDSVTAHIFPFMIDFEYIYGT
jgi:hypothetical protein